MLILKLSLPHILQVCHLHMTSYSTDISGMRFRLKELSRNKYTINNATHANIAYRQEFLPVERNVSLIGLTYSVVGVKVILNRYYSQYILSYYFTSIILVSVSWISFMIPPEEVPGRITLLITLLLVLVNILGTIIRTQPPSNSSTFLVIWVIACILFITAALFAYAALLWNNRHMVWRRYCKNNIKEKTRENQQSEETSRLPTSDMNTRGTMVFLHWDRSCILIFPITFLLFNLIYWPVVYYKNRAMYDNWMNRDPILYKWTV